MKKGRKHLLIILLLFFNTALSQFDYKNTPLYKELTLEHKEKTLMNNAFDLFNKDQLEEAYEMTHKLKKSFKTNYGIGDANLLLSQYFKNKTLADSSIYYAKLSLKYNRLNNDSLETRRRSLAYNILGINYKNKGLLEESKKWHLQGIEESRKYNEKKLYYTNTHGLAMVYNDAKDFPNSLELFKKCLEYEKDKQIIYASYINIGTIYSEMENYELANKYFKRGLKLSKKDKSYNALAVILLNLAINAQMQNQLDEAIKRYKEVITLADKHDLNRIGLMARINIGSVYIESKKYEEAEIIYATSLHHAQNSGMLSIQLNIFDNLKEIALRQNDYKKALGFMSDYFKTKDSITELQKNKEINELEVKYKTFQKEKEIKLLQIENTNRKLELTNQEEAFKNLKLQQEIEQKESQNKVLAFQNASEKKNAEIVLLKKEQELQEEKLARQKSMKNIILYSFLIILIPIIGLLINYYQRLIAQSKLNKKQKEINHQKIETLLKDQQLEVIKASIIGTDKERKRISQELHDSIGGNLAAIKLQLNNLTINGKDSLKKVNDQIDDTYQQVRNLSHNLIPKKFTINHFCDVLEEYLNNLGNASNITTIFSVYPRRKINAISREQQVEIFKIIQELITNTIKHAEANVMDLQINLIDESLNILFEDNGIGFDPENIKDGLGFTNIQNRLQKLSGILTIDSRIERGTLINIEIAKIKKTAYYEI